jgi:hypothetical protein
MQPQVVPNKLCQQKTYIGSQPHNHTLKTNIMQLLKFVNNYFENRLTGVVFDII